MTDTPPSPPPPPPGPPVEASATPPPPPPVPTPTSVSEPSYTMAELQAEAVALGVYPWDVAGVFFSKGVQSMTMSEFEKAMVEWRTPGSHETPATPPAAPLPTSTQAGGPL